MRLENSDSVESLIIQVENTFPLNSDNVSNFTDLLTTLFARLPSLSSDSQETMRRASSRVFGMKRCLPAEKQETISKMFCTLHNLTFKQGDTHPVKLNDGTTGEISRDLLARFFGKELPQTLQLDQLDHHQFVTLIALLETGEGELINDENVHSFLAVGSYFQIPEVISACSKCFFSTLRGDKSDDVKIVSLLNALQGMKKAETITKLEEKISDIFREGLCETPVSEEFLGRLAYYRENLKTPITLALSFSPITEDKLTHLQGMPITKLELFDCKNLTKHVFKVITTLPTITALELGNNKWVDDDALLEIPATISELSLSSCKNFTGQGLANLTHTNIRRLILMGCRHLKDEDLARMKDDLEGVNLSMCIGAGIKTMQRLGQMAVMRDVVLSFTKIPEASLSYLRTGLFSLDLSDCDTSDACLDHISKMSELRQLSLAYSKMTDTGLQRVPQSVEDANFNGCEGITDVGGISLAERQQLHNVSLLDCPQITEATSDALIKANKKVQWSR